MSTINNRNPSLLDVAKRTDPDGKIAQVVEILAETNEILNDMPFVEANDGTSHQTTIRTGLPEVTWRKFNYGVKQGKSRTAQVKDSCGMLEAYSLIDKDLAMLNGNSAAFRLSEDTAFLEAMSQEMATTVFYGDTAESPEKFMGLAPRFNDLSAESADNIIDAGGSGSNNTSIWLVVWGEQQIHGIYPKGSKAGLSHEDLGQDTVKDADGGEYQALRTHYQWKCGMTVRDWRYVVRIANIDVTALTKDATSGADLVDLMTQALELVPNLQRGRAVFYVNRTIKSYLRRQIKNAQNVQISMSEVAGKHVMMFDDVPVRRCDAILSSEAAVA